jgi:hypothetical protein
MSGRAWKWLFRDTKLKLWSQSWELINLDSWLGKSLQSKTQRRRSTVRVLSTYEVGTISRMPKLVTMSDLDKTSLFRFLRSGTDTIRSVFTSSSVTLLSRKMAADSISFWSKIGTWVEYMRIRGLDEVCVCLDRNRLIVFLWTRLPVSTDLELSHVTMVRFRNDANRKTGDVTGWLCSSHVKIRRVDPLPVDVQYDSGRVSQYAQHCQWHPIYFAYEPIRTRTFDDPPERILVY